VTADELRRLIEQYRAGIDAELALLRQLADLAGSQRAVTNPPDLNAFDDVADRRDEIMGNLVTIEEGLRPVRQQLTAHREVASRLEGYAEVARLHRHAGELVNAILQTDQQSLASLADLDLARRSAVASLERGEATLAAYRRVLTPPVATARLLNRRG
jgi:hypothetical protein